ncbi:uncharacterized protein LOC144435441 [Glandiceps talaboti]
MVQGSFSQPTSLQDQNPQPPMAEGSQPSSLQGPSMMPQNLAQIFQQIPPEQLQLMLVQMVQQSALSFPGGHMQQPQQAGLQQTQSLFQPMHQQMGMQQQQQQQQSQSLLYPAPQAMSMQREEVKPQPQMLHDSASQQMQQEPHQQQQQQSHFLHQPEPDETVMPQRDSQQQFQREQQLQQQSTRQPSAVPIQSPAQSLQDDILENRAQTSQSGLVQEKPFQEQQDAAMTSALPSTKLQQQPPEESVKLQKQQGEKAAKPSILQPENQNSEKQMTQHQQAAQQEDISPNHGKNEDSQQEGVPEESLHTDVKQSPVEKQIESVEPQSSGQQKESSRTLDKQQPTNSQHSEIVPSHEDQKNQARRQPTQTHPLQQVDKEKDEYVEKIQPEQKGQGFEQMKLSVKESAPTSRETASPGQVATRETVMNDVQKYSDSSSDSESDSDSDVSDRSEDENDTKEENQDKRPEDIKEKAGESKGLQNQPDQTLLSLAREMPQKAQQTEQMSAQLNSTEKSPTHGQCIEETQEPLRQKIHRQPLPPKQAFNEIFLVKLVCESCVVKTGKEVNSYKVDATRSHAKKGCKKTILLCRFNNGKEDPWRVIRKKPKKVESYLCEEIGSEQQCQNPGNCPYPYTHEEYYVWVAEENGLLNRKNNFPTLKDEAPLEIWRLKSGPDPTQGLESKKVHEEGMLAETKTADAVRGKATLEDKNTQSEDISGKNDDQSKLPREHQSGDDDLTAKLGNGESGKKKEASGTLEDVGKIDKQSQSETEKPGRVEDPLSKDMAKGIGEEESKDLTLEGGTPYMKQNLEDDSTRHGGKKKKKKNKSKKKGESVEVAVESTTELIQNIPPPGEKRMKIIFCAWMSPTFGFDAKVDKLVITSNIYAGGWKTPCVIMQQTETVLDELIMFEGALEARPMDIRYTDISYKYCVIRGSDQLWEHIPTHTSSPQNRKMKVPLEHCKPDGVWNRYDDVLYPDKTSSRWEKLKNKVQSYVEKAFGSENQVLHHKIMVTNYMLPKWEGFYHGKDASKGLAFHAILHVKQLVMSVDGHWKPHSYDIYQVLYDYLMKKLETFKTLNQNPPSAEESGSVLVSALSILHLLYHFNLLNSLKYYEIGYLFEALLIRPNTEKRECPDYDSLEHHFPTKEERKVLANAIVYLCNRTFESVQRIDPRFLLCLPILHFLREDSVPFMPLPPKANYHEWWGTTDLRISDFQDKISRQSYDVIPCIQRVKPLFDVDKLLVRSCTMALPFQDLSKVAKEDLIPAYELCCKLRLFLDTASSLQSLKYKAVDHIKELMEVVLVNMRRKLSTETEESLPFSEITLEDSFQTVCGALVLAKTVINKCYYITEYEIITQAGALYAACYAYAYSYSTQGKTRSQTTKTKSFK